MSRNKINFDDFGSFFTDHDGLVSLKSLNLAENKITKIDTLRCIHSDGQSGQVGLKTEWDRGFEQASVRRSS
jgi:hypothetical protein